MLRRKWCLVIRSTNSTAVMVSKRYWSVRNATSECGRRNQQRRTCVHYWDVVTADDADRLIRQDQEAIMESMYRQTPPWERSFNDED